MNATLPPDDDWPEDDDLPPPPPNPDDGTSRRGRRPKCTPAIIAQAAAMLRKGSFRCAVARILGVGMTTWKRWMALGKTNPVGVYGLFRAAVLKSEEEFDTRSTEAIEEAGKDDWKALAWLKERKLPHRWGQYRGELGLLKRRIAELEKMLALEEEADAVAHETVE